MKQACTYWTTRTYNFLSTCEKKDFCFASSFLSSIFGLFASSFEARAMPGINVFCMEIIISFLASNGIFSFSYFSKDVREVWYWNAYIDREYNACINVWIMYYLISYRWPVLIEFRLLVDVNVNCELRFRIREKFVRIDQ